MKKKFLAMLSAGLLLLGTVKAQKVEDGIRHLYADRYKSALKVFESLATDGKPVSAYWLAQTYLEMDNIAKATEVLNKALGANTNNPLLLVAKGQIELLQKKHNEARQKFETALTATRTKKGDDPQILNAIGRAVLSTADRSLDDYAKDKLKIAAERDPKNADILLNLGNAFRRAGKADEGAGSGGGEAYSNYDKATKLDKNFPIAYYRVAKLFETQRQYDLVLENLNKAIAVDPDFSPAYYELFYYYFYRENFTEAEKYLTKYIDSRKPETYIEDQSLYANLCWGRKDFDCAIAKAEEVVRVMGDNAPPRTYKLLANTYLTKKDFQNAKKYVDKYFTKESPDELVSYDYVLQGDIYSGTPGLESQAIDFYMKGLEAEKSVANKVKLLETVADKFKADKKFIEEGKVREKILSIKTEPNINDIFYTTVAYYLANENTISRNYAIMMRDKYPTQIFGYDWAVNNSVITDTVRYDSIAVPDVLMLYDFAKVDSVKYIKEYIKSVRFLASYYVNVKKDAPTALDYFVRWQLADTARAADIQGYIDQVKKLVQTRPTGTKPGGSGPGTSSGAKPAGIRR